MATQTVPTYTGYIDQRFFIEPVGDPVHPRNYLDIFPDTVYNKAPYSHFVRLMYSLLGPAGVGWLQKNYTEFRLKFESQDIYLADLDRFFSDPLGLPRYVDEIYKENPDSILTREQWDAIKSKDSRYRNRALDYLHGVRAGNTPEGMRYVARAGLGHEVEVIENYKYLFDAHSDDRLGLTYYGQTDSTEELIILPRHEIPRNEIQKIQIVGGTIGGSFKLQFFDQTSPPIYFDFDRYQMQTALEATPGIGIGSVSVSGGPGPLAPWYVTFTGDLAKKNLPQLVPVENYLYGPEAPTQAVVTTETGGVEGSTEASVIPRRNFYYLEKALDRLKPATTVPTPGNGVGLQKRQVWQAIQSSSSYHEVLRYVTGQNGVNWPATNDKYWIVANEERQAPRMYNDLQHHYVAFHVPPSVVAYTEDEEESSHIGTFNQDHTIAVPYLKSAITPNLTYTKLGPDRALPDYNEPILVSAIDKNRDRLFINGIYPTQYKDLKGVKPIRYKEEQFWASLERVEGTEYLEIDLGEAHAVNYIYFETISKPVEIEICYDTLDMAPRKNFISVTPNSEKKFENTLAYAGVNFVNPWRPVEYSFTNSTGEMIFTRFIRIGFERQGFDDFLVKDGVASPWSVEVRNLRVGRNVSD